MTSHFCVDKNEWSRLCPICEKMFHDQDRQGYRKHLVEESAAGKTRRIWQ